MLVSMKPGLRLVHTRFGYIFACTIVNAVSAHFDSPYPPMPPVPSPAAAFCTAASSSASVTSGLENSACVSADCPAHAQLCDR